MKDRLYRCYINRSYFVKNFVILIDRHLSELMNKRTSNDSSISFEKEVHSGSLSQQFSVINFYFEEQHFV